MATSEDLQTLEQTIQNLEAENKTLRQYQQKSSLIQEQLRESQERWQLVLRGNNDGIWDWNLKTGHLFFSPRWKEMLGYQDEKLPNHFDTWESLLHPDDLEQVTKVLQDHLQGKTPYYVAQFRLRCKDGSYKWILSRGQALWDESGTPIRMAGSHTDISDHKEKEQALKQQAEREHLLSNISGQLINQDIDTAINYTLQVLGQFSKSDRAYIIHYSDCQHHWSMIYEWCNPHKPQIQSIITQVQKIPVDNFPWFSEQLLSGKIIMINCLTDLPDEAYLERQALAQSLTPSRLIVPMINAGKTVGYLGLDAPVCKQWTKEEVNLLKLVGEFIAIATARHQAEEALKKAKNAADTANRAKSEFLANMSHELRTPLNAILGFTQVMSRDVSLSEENQNNLNIISRSGEHLLELINDILEMSKIEAGRATFNESSFDLYRLLDNLEAMLRVKANTKGIQLIFERTAEVPQYIQTDSGKLRQVLINILGNGIKFTQEGGVILRVKSQQFPENPQQITITFEVEDTGPGIANQEIDKLFSPFGQTEIGRKSNQGTGLGLPISKKFVELMGGEIRLSSILGSGSLFTFDIQVKLASANQVKIEQPIRKVVALAPEQPKYRILVVDDRSESRLLLIKLLSSVGFLVKEANNGKEAVNIWENWQPHLIWMDMRMPVMDGYEATKIIKSTIKGQATVIIALTASAFEEDRTLVLSAGCDDFMRKPFREELLWEKMAQYLGVQYIYEDTPIDIIDNYMLSLDNMQNLKAEISLMSSEWVNQLYQATQECSDDRILELIQSIPPQQIKLANTLKNLANNFLFDQVIELLNYNETGTNKTQTE